MPINEYLLGYDVREMFLDVESAWDQARREQYLLKLDVKKPLSVDCAVWPYFFDPCKSQNPHDWRIGCHDLWEDAEGLKILVESEEGRLDKAFEIIGITLTVLSYVDAEQWCQQQGILMNTLNKRMVKQNTAWIKLGFDVADGGMISGLSNCGYEPEAENVWKIREQWWPLLNEHHLFDKLEDAKQFREFANIREKDQSPFFVFGIYRIADARRD